MVWLTGQDPICFDEDSGWVAAEVFGGTPPYTFEWRKIPISTVIGTNDTLWNIGPGSYEITVTDSNNIVAVDTITLNPADTIFVNPTWSDPICYGSSTGWINTSVTGGIPPYTYLWSTGATTPDISGLSAGTYSVTVTDSAGCDTTEVVQILELPELTVNITAPDTATCLTEAIQLTANVTNGIPPFTYAWTPAGLLNDPTIQNPMALPVANTMFYVTVTDSVGCQGSDSIFIYT